MEGDRDQERTVRAEVLEGLLTLARDGDDAAREELWNLVYFRLRELARRRLQGDRKPAALHTTALVHEAWPRLQRALEGCTDVQHLMSIAATAMRQIIVDHVRFHRRQRRRPDGRQIPLDEIADRFEARSGAGVAELDDALRDLHEADPESAELVTLYFFGGYTPAEIAQSRNCSASTIRKRLDLARGSLERRLVS